MSNIIFIEFYDKKLFPPGKWINEPDLCYWEHKLPCLVLRDMGTGIWKGFVGIDEEHPYYEQSVDELLKSSRASEAMDIFLSVYGGFSGAGRLPPKYKKFAKNYWWIGIETSYGGDLIPLLKIEGPGIDPYTAKMSSNQTYKDLHFIRRETNKLANSLVKLLP